MPRRLRFALLVAAFVPVPANADLPMVATAERWRRIESPHFDLYSHADPSTMNRLARDLTRLVEVIDLTTEGLSEEPVRKRNILFFRNRSFFSPYNMNGGRPGESPLGYFQPGEDADYIAFADYKYDRSLPGQPDRQNIVFHEFIHSLLHVNLRAAPAWLHEGLAEYFSTLEPSRRSATLGVPIPHHLRQARRELMPLEVFFRVDDASPLYRTQTFYAQSWLLTHMLMRSQDDRQRFSGFLTRLKRGMEPVTAFTDVYGDSLAELEQELQDYARRTRYEVLTYAFPKALGENPHSTSVSRAEIVTLLGGLLLERVDAGDPLALATEHFQTVLDADSDALPARTGMARALARGGNPQEAEDWFALAVEDGPEDPIVLYLAGRFHLERYLTAMDDSTESSEPDPGDLARAQELLGRSVRSGARFPEAQALFGTTFLFSSIDSAYLGLAALTEAVSRMPERVDVLMSLIWLSAKVGNEPGIDQFLTMKEPVLRGRQAEAAAHLQRMSVEERDAAVRARLETVIRKVGTLGKQQ